MKWTKCDDEAPKYMEPVRIIHLCPVLGDDLEMTNKEFLTIGHLIEGTKLNGLKLPDFHYHKLPDTHYWITDANLISPFNSVTHWIKIEENKDSLIKSHKNKLKVCLNFLPYDQKMKLLRIFGEI